MKYCVLPFGGNVSICKTTQESASDTIIYVHQRGATAEDRREVSVPGRSHRVLLNYSLLLWERINQPLFSAKYVRGRGGG